ncbi:unnamed protein product, partial [Prorocentrum cordatum]
MIPKLRRTSTNESLLSGLSVFSKVGQGKEVLDTTEADPASEEAGTWHYLIVDTSGTRLRRTPAYSSTAKRSMGRLNEGTLVTVSHRRTAGMTRWLLAVEASGNQSCNGWFFDNCPKNNKVRAIEVEVSQVPHGDTWAYRSLLKVPLLPKPSLFLAGQDRFGDGAVELEEIISVKTRVRPLMGKGCLLELTNGRGWVIDFHKGQMRFERLEHVRAFPCAEEDERSTAVEAFDDTPHSGASTPAHGLERSNTMQSSCSTWAPTSSSATPMLSLAPAEFGEWEYVVMDPKGITLRGTPSISQSSKLKVRVSEGELVKVVERRPATNATFLRLEKPAGWSVDSRDRRVRLKQVVTESGHWFYRVSTPNGIALRSGCCFSDGSKIGAGPREGALLVAEQRVQVDDTAFLKLKDSAGWVFDQKSNRRVLEGPLSLQDMHGRAAIVTAPGGAFLLQQPTKKSWAQTRRLLLQDARVRVGLVGQLEP